MASPGDEWRPARCLRTTQWIHWRCGQLPPTSVNPRAAGRPGWRGSRRRPVAPRAITGGTPAPWSGGTRCGGLPIVRRVVVVAHHTFCDSGQLSMNCRLTETDVATNHGQMASSGSTHRSRGRLTAHPQRRPTSGECRCYRRKCVLTYGMPRASTRFATGKFAQRFDACLSLSASCWSPQRSSTDSPTVGRVDGGS